MAARESIGSPLVTSSTALPRPTIRGVRAVPPQPGNRPSFTSGKAKLVLSSSAMIRRSHQSASSVRAAGAEAADRGNGDERTLRQPAEQFLPLSRDGLNCFRGLIERRQKFSQVGPGDKIARLGGTNHEACQAVEFFQVAEVPVKIFQHRLREDVHRFVRIVEREHCHVVGGKFQRKHRRLGHRVFCGLRVRVVSAVIAEGGSPRSALGAGLTTSPTSKLHSMELDQSSTDGVEGNPGDDPSHGGWVFPALLAAVLLIGVVVALGNRRPESQGVAQRADGDWTPSDESRGRTVALEIDFGNGARKHFAALPWQPEMTVAQLMKAALEFRPGIEFSQLGTGASGLLTSIDGLKNEGAGGRNWRYRVVDRSGNDRYGEVSFCLEPVEPGMSVLWEFAAGDYNTSR